RPPGVLVDLRHVGERLDAGVVDEAGDSSRLLDDLFHETGVGVGDVAGDHEGPGQLGRQRLGLSGSGPVVDGDSGAGGVEAAGDPPTDASGGAGDEHHLSAEVDRDAHASAARRAARVVTSRRAASMSTVAGRPSATTWRPSTHTARTWSGVPE